jgi:hypothetical protein
VALKIEKIWGNVFGSGTVKRKESAVRDEKPDQQHQQPDKEDQNEAQNQDAKSDPQLVQKAIDEMKTHQNFISTGIHLDMVNTAMGLFVRFSQANGTQLKTMTAEDFLKLKTVSTATESGAGKILDQKF